jgi:hypothetical protein
MQKQFQLFLAAVRAMDYAILAGMTMIYLLGRAPSALCNPA